MEIDILIKMVCNLLKNNASESYIHDIMISHGVSEENIFLIVQAGKLLLKSINECQETVVTQPTFKRYL